MKLIEALKKQKYLLRKAEDIRQKVKNNCARSSLETDKYPDQAGQIQGWLQSHSDIIKEISSLRYYIQKTNLVTSVPIQLGSKVVTKSIAEWIFRRRDLALEELKMFQCLTDRGIKEGLGTGPSGDELSIKIVRFYNIVERDKTRERLQEEPMLIDGALEIINATTDLLDS